MATFKPSSHGISESALRRPSSYGTSESGLLRSWTRIVNCFDDRSFDRKHRSLFHSAMVAEDAVSLHRM